MLPAHSQGEQFWGRNQKETWWEKSWGCGRAIIFARTNSKNKMAKSQGMGRQLKWFLKKHDHRSGERKGKEGELGEDVKQKLVQETQPNCFATSSLKWGVGGE